MRILEMVGTITGGGTLDVVSDQAGTGEVRKVVFQGEDTAAGTFSIKAVQHHGLTNADVDGETIVNGVTAVGQQTVYPGRFRDTATLTDIEVVAGTKADIPFQLVGERLRLTVASGTAGKKVRALVLVG